MKKILLFICFWMTSLLCCGENIIRMGKEGCLKVKTIAPNAVRIQFVKNEKAISNIPDWIYISQEEVKSSKVSVSVDKSTGHVQISNQQGSMVFTATNHQLKSIQVAGEETYEATLSFFSPHDEYLFGLGQFQDGYVNVRGLSRRLTQVNTQISIPMLISNKGYGILWNNYGMTEYNPCDNKVELNRLQAQGQSEIVNVTSTEGGKQEIRERHIFETTIEIDQEGDYSLLLDVGQKMARRHHLAIDGKTVINFQNLWLPPTASKIVHLNRGKHVLQAELTKDDHPTVYYNRVTDQTTFRSPAAECVDYTVFLGSPDEIIATYRHLTGDAPLIPQWALGYIHCRERFHSSEEILQTARRFREEKLPVDVLVQDWQYWGKHGWNSMTFDEDHYPDPKALTDSLHQMKMRLMVSVWSKIDKNSEVGRQMEKSGFYIPETDWVDFFNPSAAAAYWDNFNRRLVPLGIDAWWQDATEPENDDLLGRRVYEGKYAGELLRNVYPLFVNKTVYEGLRSNQPNQRPLILTRSGFPGIQRYGTAMWSGDVGNDWETFRRQIVAGLGIQAAGIPWWTYDAGGFFRPGNQYTDKDYIQRMLRWIETSVFLPLMRVHGYMSNTEPWNYGEEAQSVISNCLKERYRLMPYIYSEAADVSFNGSTLMRPLVFDFADDEEALKQKYEYMFGKSILVSPVTEPDVTTWRTYLPKHAAGWYDYYTMQFYQGGQYVTTSVDLSRIPIFVKGGSLIPVCEGKQYAADMKGKHVNIRVFPGSDATFTLYEDDGYTFGYEKGHYKKTLYRWNEQKKHLSKKVLRK